MKLNHYSALIFLFFFFLVSFSPVLSKKASEWNSEGVKHYNKGEYEEAIKCFNEALKLDPKSPVLWLNKGNAYFMLENYEKAAGCYKEGLKYDPTDNELIVKEEEARTSLSLKWIKAGDECFSKQMYKEAISYYDEALRIIPEQAYAKSQKKESERLLALQEEENIQEPVIEEVSVEELFVKGNEFLANSNYKEAIDCFDRILEIEPENSEAWDKKGLSFLNLGDKETALGCYDRTVAYCPENGEAWLHRAEILYDLDRYEEAIESFDKVTDLESDNKVAWFGKADVYSILGSYEKELSCYEFILNNLDSECAEAWNNRGFCLEEDWMKYKENYEEAIRSYDTAIKLDPDCSDAILNKEIAIKGPAVIIEECNDILAKNPEDIRAWYYKGKAIYRTGIYNEALTCFEKVLDLDSSFSGAEIYKKKIQYFMQHQG